MLKRMGLKSSTYCLLDFCVTAVITLIFAFFVIPVCAFSFTPNLGFGLLVYIYFLFNLQSWLWNTVLRHSFSKMVSSLVYLVIIMS